MDRKVACFEVVNNAGYQTDGLFGNLIDEAEVQRRLEFVANRTLEMAEKVVV
jgi:hypothetical protein